jgi:hypothetical protein
MPFLVLAHHTWLRRTWPFPHVVADHVVRSEHLDAFTAAAPAFSCTRMRARWPQLGPRRACLKHLAVRPRRWLARAGTAPDDVIEAHVAIAHEVAEA